MGFGNRGNLKIADRINKTLRVVSVFIFLGLCSEVSVASFEPFFTWVSGANMINQTGVYGSKGVAASANIPGARWRSWKSGEKDFFQEETVRCISVRMPYRGETNQTNCAIGAL